MRTKSPLKWFGGKYYLAPEIVKRMPPHVHYVEPFFGGGAVLWAKDPQGKSEVVNDIHGRLMNFYRHLQAPHLFQAFYRVVSTLPFSQPLWEECQEQAEDPLADAVRFFVYNRQSRAGQMKDFATLSRKRTRRGMNEQVSSWLSCVEGLPEVHERLKLAVILNDEALKVIHQQDGPDTLFYLDPPYMHETRTGSDNYHHEMTRGDHEDLVNLLPQVEGKVILSGYANPMYDFILEDWRREEFQIDNKASGAKTKRKMTEILWMNF